MTDEDYGSDVEEEMFAAFTVGQIVKEVTREDVALQGDAHELENMLKEFFL